MGFFHEQSRPDRDNYVKVIYDTIIPGLEHNFDKYNDSEVDTLNTPYDYGSIMHYGRNYFSINGSDTLVPLDPTAIIGQRDTLTPIDIEEIQIFYGCIPPITTTASITITTSTTTKIGTTNTTNAGNSTAVNKITITVATTVATTRAAVTNDDSNNDSGNIGIIVGSVVGGVVFVVFLAGVIGICCCLYFCKGSPLRSNKAYVRDGLRAQKDLGNAIFQPGALAGYFYKDGAWQGPHDLTLAFYPKANHTVYGKGIDNLGTFVATGSYSPRTLRMAFEKRYQKGLGDTSQNPGQTMIIQAEWNPNT
ncbi:unnamed protein product [Adineta steineri]|nr:unnamed protein product [Adineta steineri]